MATIEQIEALLEAKLERMLEAKLAPLTAAVASLTTQVASLATQVASLTTQVASLTNTVSILSAKQANASVTRDEQLIKVPLPNGHQPATDEYPTNLMQLLVAGNERLPNGQQNAWNSKKSKLLLQKYGEVGGGGSDSENEHSEGSRSRRLKVARVLGITTAQLNFAQLIL